VEAAARIAFNGNLTAAVCSSQRMLGAKLFKGLNRWTNQASCCARSAIASNLGDRGRYARGGGSGLATYDWRCRITAQFLSLARWEAQSRRIGTGSGTTETRVLVVTGDGEMLMGLGALATAAAEKPSNSQSPSSTTSIMAKRGCNRPTPARVSILQASRAVRLPPNRDREADARTRPRYRCCIRPTAGARRLKSPHARPAGVHCGRSVPSRVSARHCSGRRPPDDHTVQVLRADLGYNSEPRKRPTRGFERPRALRRSNANETRFELLAPAVPA